MYEIPVLLIAFNRPQFLKSSLDNLHKLGVQEIWVHIDAPRENNEKDQNLVLECLSVTSIFSASFIKLNVKIADKNLGCKYGPIKAIHWFFEENDAGVILEDDVLVSEGFFKFCSDALLKFKHDFSVWQINGWSPFDEDEISIDYWKSRYPIPWGWATWKNRWTKSEFSKNYRKDLIPSTLRSIAGKKISPEFNSYWTKAFQSVSSGLDAWDYEWFHEIWLNGGYAITPTKRLTANVGFDQSSTHTQIPVGRSASTIAEKTHLQVTENAIFNEELDLATDRLLFAMSYQKQHLIALDLYLTVYGKRKLHKLLVPRFGIIRVARKSYEILNNSILKNFIIKILTLAEKSKYLKWLIINYKSKVWLD